jgi:hypothetical protein
MGHIFPVSVEELSLDSVNTLIRAWTPDATVGAFTVVDSRMHGDGMASTAGRIILDLTYEKSNGRESTGADLPRRVVMKVARADRFSQPLYANEVAIYQAIAPASIVRAPRCIGGAYDVESVTFGLILEDLTVEGATFPNATTPVSLAYVEGVLEQLARLHARFWDSPRLTNDLAWLETHVSGAIFHFFMDPHRLPAHILREVQETQFKREMVARLGLEVHDLHVLTSKVQHHQSGLVPTLVHGDTHLGNTYMMPGDRAGLVDWQLSVRGYFMHDVGYIIPTALSVADRRRHERDLLRYALEKLREFGVASPPDFDTAWLEYRRAQAWNVYIGWLTTPVLNYGWEITLANHLRVMTAFEDLETAKAASPLS